MPQSNRILSLSHSCTLCCPCALSRYPFIANRQPLARRNASPQNPLRCRRAAPLHSPATPFITNPRALRLPPPRFPWSRAAHRGHLHCKRSSGPSPHPAALLPPTATRTFRTDHTLTLTCPRSPHHLPTRCWPALHSLAPRSAASKRAELRWTCRDPARPLARLLSPESRHAERHRHHPQVGG